MSHDDAVPLVQAKGLKKDYGATHAVQDISFSVSRGEVVGFLGPNGAGKSTTMKMLTGFLRPTAGDAYVGGHNVGAEPLQAQQLLGYLPESAPMYDDMMVRDFLLLVSDLRGVPEAQRNKRLREVCERCGLGDVLGKDIGQLSKGYRQRVGLAQALVHDPALLILDEPTSGLDPNQIVEIRALIRDLGRDKTVILSTHILPEVQATCGRIIIISDGRLVADDTPEALTQEGTGAVIRVAFQSKNGTSLDPDATLSVINSVPGVRRATLDPEAEDATMGLVVHAEGSEDPRAAIFSRAVEKGFVLVGMHKERVSLEHTFRRLTRGDDAAGSGGGEREERSHA